MKTAALTYILLLIFPAVALSLTRTQELKILKVLESYEETKEQYIQTLIHADELRADKYSMDTHDLFILQRNIEHLSRAISAAEEGDIYRPRPPKPEQRFWYAIKEAVFAMSKVVELEGRYQSDRDPLALILRAKYEDAVRTSNDYLLRMRAELSLQ